jgi:branched-chain amino acid transport system ATP-binding protein
MVISRSVPTTNGQIATSDIMLQVQDIHCFYGRIEALKGITIAVNRGEIVTLIGSNGAGKSTTLKTISGLVQPRDGRILLNGQPLNGVPAHKIATMGVAQSPEGRRVFPRMTVIENLEMGAFARRKVDPDDLTRVFDLFPRLKERINQKAGTLSGGEQQMLAIGRALMAHPTLLLLDEPSMGLAPILVEAIFSIVKDINAQGTTILLVEQNALMALAIANRGYVLQTGKIVLADNARSLLRNEMVRKAYLGED